MKITKGLKMKRNYSNKTMFTVYLGYLNNERYTLCQTETVAEQDAEK